MTEHPLNSTADEVRGYLDGRKTQTMRLIKNPGKLDGLMLLGEEGEWCPYGNIGDRLWVRETYGFISKVRSDIKQSLSLFEYEIPDMTGCEDEYDWIARGAKMQLEDDSYIVYRADGNHENVYWRAPITMPHYLSRIDLEITRIRAMQLHDLTMNDAKAQGVNPNDMMCPKAVARDCLGVISDAWTSRLAISWNDRHAKDGHGWNTNSWVWVFDHHRIRP